MIGGNVTAMLQVSVATRNAIGETVRAWHDVIEIKGWLDLSSGQSKYTTYDAKIQESTHIFVATYKPIPESITVDGEIVRVCAENCRLLAKSQYYDVMVIDNPMELNKQLEIYLKYTGRQ